MAQDRPVSQIYLAAVPVLAAVLLGVRPSLWWLGVTGTAVLGIGVLDGGGLLLRPFIIALNFVFITGIITLSCAFLLGHLASTAGNRERHRRRDGGRAQRTARAQPRTAPDLGQLARLNDMVLIAEVGHRPGDAQAIIFVNDAFERRSGYLRAELLGRPAPAGPAPPPAA